MMESLNAMHGASVTLPCISSHTMIRSPCGVWERRDRLASGICGTRSLTGVLCFDASGLSGFVPAAAVLYLSVCNKWGCVDTLCVTNDDGAAHIFDACVACPIPVDVISLLGTQPGKAMLHIAISPVPPCAGFVTLEQHSPPPCIVVTPDDAPDTSAINVKRHHAMYAFEGHMACEPIDTARAREFTFFVTNTGEDSFTVEMETSADGQHWVRDAWRTVAPGETQALVAKFYSTYTRINLTAPGTGHAEISFIGQYFR